jgi:peptidyl-prolyl cis-trans isomerase SurA
MLNQALGYGGDEQSRKRALQDLIDDVLKQAEGKRNQIVPTDKQIELSIERLAKGSGTTVEGLTQSLKSKGVSMSTLKRHVTSSIIFNWIVSRKHNIKVEVDQAEVDRRYNTILSDPRLKPVEIFEIVEVVLPVESSSQAMMSQLMYARAIEARQIAQRYKGCGSLRQASSGIFNVQISKPVQAVADKLPKEMRSVLQQAGTSKLIGPMRGRTGVQLVAFCGRKSLAPPKPSREKIEDMVRGEKYRLATERILRDLRRTAFIDYKDTSLTQ